MIELRYKNVLLNTASKPVWPRIFTLQRGFPAPKYLVNCRENRRFRWVSAVAQTKTDMFKVQLHDSRNYFDNNKQTMNRFWQLIPQIDSWYLCTYLYSVITDWKLWRRCKTLYTKCTSKRVSFGNSSSFKKGQTKVRIMESWRVNANSQGSYELSCALKDFQSAWVSRFKPIRSGENLNSLKFDRSGSCPLISSILL